MKISMFLEKIFNLFKKKSKKDTLPHLELISEDFKDEDRITRTIFSPINLKKKKKDVLNANIFIPPYESEDLSVNRLDYTETNFIKRISKLIEQPDKLRKYHGISVLNVLQIKKAKADIVYTPTYINNDKVVDFPNPVHSDIKIGHIVVRGQTLPAHISLKIDELVSSSRVYVDPNPDEDVWNGAELK